MEITAIDFLIIVVLMVTVKFLIEELKKKKEKKKESQMYDLHLNERFVGKHTLEECERIFNGTGGKHYKKHSFSKTGNEFFIKREKTVESQKTEHKKGEIFKQTEVQVKEIDSERVEYKGKIVKHSNKPEIGGLALCLKIDYHNIEYLTKGKYYLVDDYIFEERDGTDTSIIGDDGTPCGVHQSFADVGFKYFN